LTSIGPSRRILDLQRAVRELLRYLLLNMRFFRLLALVAGVLVASSPTAWADVHLSIQNGRVTLVARDATLGQILAEWERVGQTKIVNGDRVPGGPVTLELSDVTEEHALSVLLRTISGYVAAPREVELPNASRFDRIVVMPTAAAAPPASATSSGAQPTFAQPVTTPRPFMMPPQVADDDDQQPQPQPPPQPQPGRPGAYTAFPPPQATGGVPMAQPDGSGAPAQVPLMLPPPLGSTPPASTSPAPNLNYPTAGSGGVAVPGMVVPAPAQPGQTGAAPSGRE
jgi:hypothetical protein